MNTLAGTLAGWAAARPAHAAAAAAAVALTTTTAVATCRALVAAWRARRLAAGARQVTIAPPPQVDPAGATQWWTTLVGVLTPTPWRRRLFGTPHISFEYTWNGRQLAITVWVPGTVPPGVVEATATACWPGATCTTHPAAPPLPAGTTAATGGALSLARGHTLPLATIHHTDPLRPLIAAGANLRGHDHITVQILARPASPRRVRTAHRHTTRMHHTPSGGAADPAGRAVGAGAGALLEPVLWAVETFQPGTPPSSSSRGRAGGQRGGAGAGGRDPARERQARAAVDKTTTAGPLWQVTIRYAVATTTGRGSRQHTRRLRGIAHTVASAFSAHTGTNTLHRHRLPRPATTLAARRPGRGFLLAADELKWIATLPTDLAVPGLERARAKTAPTPVAVPAGGRSTRVLGRAHPAGHSVALPTTDARHHIHLVGKTGTGKSTLLLNMITGDVKAGRGAVIIDPRGDLADELIDRIPAAHAHQVVLIDPTQHQHGHPSGCFNPLEGHDPHLAVDQLVGVFSRIFARHWGPRIDDTMRVACLTLMRRANPALSLVPPLLTDPQFRARFTVDLDDPEGLHGYWKWYDQMNPAMRAQVIGPVLARLRQFLLRDFVKHTIGTANSSFDMTKVLDRGLLICRLPKGTLGEDTTRILGSLLVARVWHAATARADQPEHTRRDTTLYIDECHNFLNLPGSVADMLAEARGYRLSLVLAHQDLQQLPKEIAAAASANARNKIYFTVDPRDARELATHTLPELDEHDLSHLDRHTAAARLVINAQETPAFTLTTKPPPDPVGEATAVRANANPGSTATQPTGIETLARQLARQRTPSNTTPAAGPPQQQ